MQFRKIAVLFSVCVLGSWSVAQKAHAVNLTVFGAMALPGASIQDGTGFTYPSHSSVNGFGALFGFNMFPRMMIDVGALYVPRGFGVSSPILPSNLEVNFNTVQIPLVLHYSFLPSFALGVGGYFSHGVGSIKTVSTADSSQFSYSSYGPGSFSADDHGLVLSLSLKVSLLPFFSLVLDGRYLYGLQNISQMGSMTAYLRDLQILGGIRLGK